MSSTTKIITTLVISGISLGISWFKPSSTKALQCDELIDVSNRTHELSEIVNQDLEELGQEFEELTTTISNRLEENNSVFSAEYAEDFRAFANASSNTAYDLDIIHKLTKSFLSSAEEIIMQFSEDATNEFQQIKIEDKGLSDLKNQYVILASEEILKSVKQDIKPIEEISYDITAMSGLLNHMSSAFIDLDNLLQSANSGVLSRRDFNSKLHSLEQKIKTYANLIESKASSMENLPEFQTPALDILDRKEDELVAKINTYCDHLPQS